VIDASHTRSEALTDRKVSQVGPYLRVAGGRTRGRYPESRTSCG